MTEILEHCLTTARRRVAQLKLSLGGAVMLLFITVTARWERVRATGDRGSESVEKAVLVAIGLAVAIGLGVAIRAVVQQFQGQIK